MKGDGHGVLRRDRPELVHRVDENALASVGSEQVHRGPLSGKDVDDQIGRRRHQGEGAKSARRELPLVLEGRGHARDVGVARRNKARVETLRHARKSGDRVDGLDARREALRVETPRRHREFRPAVGLAALARARHLVTSVTGWDQRRRVRPRDDPVQIGLRAQRFGRSVTNTAGVDLDGELAAIERLRLDLKGTVRRRDHSDG
ncbi:MAG: hypothetical protein E6I14_04095 [Chloroflexi bacterium]|nr:MAG: hypothetical protein E6I14_04095 [Chloroflexota bacterium]